MITSTCEEGAQAVSILTNAAEDIDNVAGELIARAKRQLDSAVAELPPEQREEVEVAVDQLRKADRLKMRSRLSNSFDQLLYERDGAHPMSYTGMPPSATTSDMRTYLPLEDGWKQVARMIGIEPVTAARLKELSMQAGRPISITQAARKLHSWFQSEQMVRTERGVYEFSEQGRRRYGIASSEED